MKTVELILVIFTILQIKHFLADFVFQTDRMVREKGIYGHLHGVYHSLIHSLGTFLAFSLINVKFGTLAAIIDFVLHYHIDWAKININRHRGLTTQDREFWIWLGLDQMAHQLTYILLVGGIFFGIYS